MFINRLLLYSFIHKRIIYKFEQSFLFLLVSFYTWFHNKWVEPTGHDTRLGTEVGANLATSPLAINS